MRDITLLWALRSPCNLGCRYCYFGTIEEDRDAPPGQPGQLSHLSRTDISLADVSGFLSTVADSAVQRIFLAGGEPLIWPPIFTVVEMIKAAGVQVVLCTNGIPLSRPKIVANIIDLGVDAVSVSLDSADPAHNDHYRPSRNGRHSWGDVVTGVRALRTARGSRDSPKTGLYSVITRRNIPAVGEVAQLTEALDLDYYVPQPISLTPEHALYHELAFRKSDIPALEAALGDLYTGMPSIGLPGNSYPQLLLSTVTMATQLVPGCFGGHQLAFIEPDGSIWPCPSRHKIAATTAPQHRTIRGHHAAELFGMQRRTCPHDCALMSDDCVNMWPLMGFDRFLRPAGTP